MAQRKLSHSTRPAGFGKPSANNVIAEPVTAGRSDEEVLASARSKIVKLFGLPKISADRFIEPDALSRLK